MKKSLLLVSMMGAMCIPAMSAVEYMEPGKMTYPTSDTYLEIPGAIEFQWDSIFELTDPQVNEWDELYSIVEVSIDEAAPVGVPAYYIYSEAWTDENGNVIFPEECILNIALYELYDLGIDYDDATSISISIPEGMVKNKAGEVNPAQTILLTKSPYADLDYFYDLTWDPEDGSDLVEGEAVVKISCEGYPISYLQGEIRYNNYDLWAFGSLEFGKQVSINEDNELVIDLSNEEPGEVEIMLPEAYLLVDVDGENQLSASLSLEYYIIEAETDGVSSVGSDSAPKRIYKLNGVRVDSKGKLAPGIYVINGKKVAIK